MFLILILYFEFKGARFKILLSVAITLALF